MCQTSLIKRVVVVMITIDCILNLSEFLNVPVVCCMSPPTGQFQEHKAYQVSVFKVLNSNEVLHLSSEIGYSHQKGGALCFVPLMVSGHCSLFSVIIIIFSFIVISSVSSAVI